MSSTTFQVHNSQHKFASQAYSNNPSQRATRSQLITPESDPDQEIDNSWSHSNHTYDTGYPAPQTNRRVWSQPALPSLFQLQLLPSPYPRANTNTNTSTAHPSILPFQQSPVLSTERMPLNLLLEPLTSTTTTLSSSSSSTNLAHTNPTFFNPNQSQTNSLPHFNQFMEDINRAPTTENQSYLHQNYYNYAQYVRQYYHNHQEWQQRQEVQEEYLRERQRKKEQEQEQEQLQQQERRQIPPIPPQQRIPTTLPSFHHQYLVDTQTPEQQIPSLRDMGLDRYF